MVKFRKIKNMGKKDNGGDSVARLICVIAIVISLIALVRSIEGL